MRKGTIAGVIRLGRTWQLLYDIDGNGLGVVDFDRGPFANFYKLATGKNFYRDTARDCGDVYIARQLKGLRISVEGKRPSRLLKNGQKIQRRSCCRTFARLFDRS